MGSFKTYFRQVIGWGCIICLFLFLSYRPSLGQNAEAEQNYQRFLEVYRQNSPAKSELKNALSFLETANLLAPNTYKYVFSLGALNNSLGNWKEAVEWLEKAGSLTITDEQRDLIQSELEYCQVQLAKAKVSDYGEPGISISFIMKKGTVEMNPDTIDRLPQRLPVVSVGNSVQQLTDELRRAIDGSEFQALYHTPFLVVGLDRYDSPESYYEKGIKDFYRYFKAQYFDTQPQRVLTTVISSNPHDLVAATHRLYPSVGLSLYAPFLGYYNPADNLIMATGGRAGYGTLLHEMIHALMAADFPSAPAWLNEGMASLYERSRWRNGRLEALPNWRMDRMREDRIPSLQSLAQSAPQIGLHSSRIDEIRLLLLLLDQRQQMDDLYRIAKQQRSGFSLPAVLDRLNVKEEEWRRFVTETFRDYRAEITRGRGALSNPDEVRFLQQALNEVMGTNLSTDGLWGPSTQQMLVAFQRRQGLTPDGILGPKTLAEIKRQYAIVRVDALD